jgi:predicted RNA binding protein YcfA (HicA-like mRNA interferase family)/predicted RNase H-like HicB family nuclease
MPRKIRELIRDLEIAGFENRGGKGDHRNFVHEKVRRPVTIDGKKGDDAKTLPGACRKGRDQGVETMKPSAHYAKIVEWSEEDQCFVGSCPGLLFGGCHGDNEQAVFARLCEIVDEAIELYQQDGKALPPSTAGKDYANKMLEIA